MRGVGKYHVIIWLGERCGPVFCLEGVVRIYARIQWDFLCFFFRNNGNSLGMWYIIGDDYIITRGFVVLG